MTNSGRAMLLNSVSEDAWLKQVISWAHRGGFLVYHVHDSRQQEWGTDAGVPDLMIAKPGHPLWLPELKTQRGVVTIKQTAWLKTLRLATTIEAPVWRPGDEDEVRRALLGAA